MQQSPSGQSWPQQGQPQYGNGQPSQPLPPNAQWNQQPPLPYPPQQGQWQQPYGQPPPNWQPQQPPKKKSKLPIIIGVIVALVVFACIGAGALAVHTGSPNAATTTTSSSTSNNNAAATTPTTAPTTKHFKQTQAVQVGNTWNVEIISAKTSTGSEFNKPQKAGNVFLVFTIKVKNISSQEQNISSALNFTLQDSNGQKYDETIDTDAGSTLDGKVEPNAPLQGSITYEVPASIKTFTLAFEADLLAQGEVIWDIHV